MTNTKKQYALDQYQSDAMTFRKSSANELYALLNLSGEVGELHSLIAKGIRDGRKEDYNKQIVSEIGDIMWCCAAILADHAQTLESAAIFNIEKLNSRKSRGVISGSGNDR